MINKKTITLYEYGSLKIGTHGFTEKHFKALAELWKKEESVKKSYDQHYTLGNQRIHFKQFVGVIDLGDLTIEILPKIGKDDSIQKEQWRFFLFQMLGYTFDLKIDVKFGAIGTDKRNILELYFHVFLEEVQKLIHRGLIKNYVETTELTSALKGKWRLEKQLTTMPMVKEKFLSTYQKYTKDIPINQIVKKALSITQKKSQMYSHLSKKILLDFEDVGNIQRPQWDRLDWNRKTIDYQSVIKLAKPIIESQSINMGSTKNELIVLLFDMNYLWEKYVTHWLKKCGDGWTIKTQTKKTFWGQKTLKPDVVLNNGNQNYILDTKWKNIENDGVSDDDLKQMFCYNELFDSKHAVLIYPSTETRELVRERYKTDSKSLLSLYQLNPFEEDGGLKKKEIVDILKVFFASPPKSE